MEVVFIVSRFPYPLEKGDKLRAFQHIINLYNSGIRVNLIAVSDVYVSKEAIDKVQPFCSRIDIIKLSKIQILVNLIFSFIRKIPIQIGYFYSGRFKKKIEMIIQQVNPDIVYCQLIRTALFAKDIKNIPMVIDYQDAFSQGTQQRLEKAPDLLKWLYRREISLVKAFEFRSFKWFDLHFIISQQDRDWLFVDVRDKIRILPNGIDTDYFRPETASLKYDVTFVGNMQYPPNVDGAVYLINEIMPVVWKKFPKATVQLGGAHPDARVKALQSDLVHVTGWVDDIRDCYKKSKVFVAPMRIGTGLQNKLLEAMAMQIACVTTPLSYEPLGAQNEVNILIGNTAADLAEQVILLLTDEELRKRIGQEGRKFVQEKYSLGHSRAILKKEFDALIINES